MRNVLEERVEALENIILDLTDILMGVSMPTVTVPPDYRLFQALNEVGMKLSQLFATPMTSQVSAAVPSGEVLDRLRAARNRMLDQRSGIT